MAQRLRVLDAPPEDTGLIHNIYMTAYNCLTPGLRDLMPSSGPWGHQAFTRCTDIHASRTSTYVK